MSTADAVADAPQPPGEHAAGMRAAVTLDEQRVAHNDIGTITDAPVMTAEAASQYALSRASSRAAVEHVGASTQCDHDSDAAGGGASVDARAVQRVVELTTTADAGAQCTVSESVDVGTDAASASPPSTPVRVHLQLAVTSPAPPPAVTPAATSVAVQTGSAPDSASSASHAASVSASASAPGSPAPLDASSSDARLSTARALAAAAALEVAALERSAMREASEARLRQEAREAHAKWAAARATVGSGASALALVAPSSPPSSEPLPAAAIAPTLQASQAARATVAESASSVGALSARSRLASRAPVGQRTVSPTYVIRVPEATEDRGATAALHASVLQLAASRAAAGDGTLAAAAAPAASSASASRTRVPVSWLPDAMEIRSELPAASSRGYVPLADVLRAQGTARVVVEGDDAAQGAPSLQGGLAVPGASASASVSVSAARQAAASGTPRTSSVSLRVPGPTSGPRAGASSTPPPTPASGRSRSQSAVSPGRPSAAAVRSRSGSVSGRGAGGPRIAAASLEAVSPLIDHMIDAALRRADVVRRARDEQAAFANRPVGKLVPALHLQRSYRVHGTPVGRITACSDLALVAVCLEAQVVLCDVIGGGARTVSAGGRCVCAHLAAASGLLYVLTVDGVVSVFAAASGERIVSARLAADLVEPCAPHSTVLRVLPAAVALASEPLAQRPDDVLVVACKRGWLICDAALLAVHRAVDLDSAAAGVATSVAAVCPCETGPWVGFAVVLLRRSAMALLARIADGRVAAKLFAANTVSDALVSRDGRTVSLVDAVTGELALFPLPDPVALLGGTQATLLGVEPTALWPARSVTGASGASPAACVCTASNLVAVASGSTGDGTLRLLAPDAQPVLLTSPTAAKHVPVWPGVYDLAQPVYNVTTYPYAPVLALSVGEPVMTTCCVTLAGDKPSERADLLVGITRGATSGHVFLSTWALCEGTMDVPASRLDFEIGAAQRAPVDLDNATRWLGVWNAASASLRTRTEKAEAARRRHSAQTLTLAYELLRALCERDAPDAPLAVHRLTFARKLDELPVPDVGSGAAISRAARMHWFLAQLGHLLPRYVLDPTAFEALVAKCENPEDLVRENDLMRATRAQLRALVASVGRWRATDGALVNMRRVGGGALLAAELLVQDLGSVLSEVAAASVAARAAGTSALVARLFKTFSAAPPADDAESAVPAPAADAVGGAGEDKSVRGIISGSAAHAVMGDTEFSVDVNRPLALFRGAPQIAFFEGRRKAGDQALAVAVVAPDVLESVQGDGMTLAVSVRRRVLLMDRLATADASARIVPALVGMRRSEHGHGLLMAFERLEGWSTLRAVLETRGALGLPSSAPVLVRWMRCMLEAVRNVHRTQHALRDLRAERWLVSPDGQQVVLAPLFDAVALDARGQGSGGIDNALPATAPYAAPEICDAARETAPLTSCSRATDVWQLGCVFADMIFGHVPQAQSEKHSRGLLARVLDAQAHASTGERVFGAARVVSRGGVATMYADSDDELVGVGRQVLELVAACLRDDCAVRPSATQLLRSPLFVSRVARVDSLDDSRALMGRWQPALGARFLLGERERFPRSVAHGAAALLDVLTRAPPPVGDAPWSNEASACVRGAVEGGYLAAIVDAALAARSRPARTGRRASTASGRARSTAAVVKGARAALAAASSSSETARGDDPDATPLDVVTKLLTRLMSEFRHPLSLLSPFVGFVLHDVLRVYHGRLELGGAASVRDAERGVRPSWTVTRHRTLWPLLVQALTEQGSGSPRLPVIRQFLHATSSSSGDAADGEQGEALSRAFVIPQGTVHDALYYARLMACVPQLERLLGVTERPSPLQQQTAVGALVAIASSDDEATYRMLADLRFMELIAPLCADPAPTITQAEAVVVQQVLVCFARIATGRRVDAYALWFFQQPALWSLIAALLQPVGLQPGGGSSAGTGMTGASSSSANQLTAAQLVVVDAALALAHALLLLYREGIYDAAIRCGALEALVALCSGGRARPHARKTLLLLVEEAHPLAVRTLHSVARIKQRLAVLGSELPSVVPTETVLGDVLDQAAARGGAHASMDALFDKVAVALRARAFDAGSSSGAAAGSASADAGSLWPRVFCVVARALREMWAQATREADRSALDALVSRGQRLVTLLRAAVDLGSTAELLDGGAFDELLDTYKFRAPFVAHSPHASLPLRVAIHALCEATLSAAARCVGAAALGERLVRVGFGVALADSLSADIADVYEAVRQNVFESVVVDAYGNLDRHYRFALRLVLAQAGSVDLGQQVAVSGLATLLLSQVVLKPVLFTAQFRMAPPEYLPFVGRYALRDLALWLFRLCADRANVGARELWPDLVLQIKRQRVIERDCAQLAHAANAALQVSVLQWLEAMASSGEALLSQTLAEVGVLAQIDALDASLAHSKQRPRAVAEALAPARAALASAADRR